jgi:hypothetical protein
MNANIRTIGGAIGSSVGASVLASGVSAAAPIPKDAGYTHVFWMLAAAGVLAALAALIIPAVRQRPGAGSERLDADDTEVAAGV